MDRVSVSKVHLSVLDKPSQKPMHWDRWSTNFVQARGLGLVGFTSSFPFFVRPEPRLGKVDPEHTIRKRQSCSQSRLGLPPQVFPRLEKSFLKNLPPAYFVQLIEKREGRAGKEREKSGLERLGLSLEQELIPGPIFSLPPLKKKCGSHREMAGTSASLTCHLKFEMSYFTSCTK